MVTAADGHPMIGPTVSCYLAGPKRGSVTFRATARWLRDLGWQVFTPAGNGSQGFDCAMAHDLKAVCEMDCVIYLPGWEGSQGARLEGLVAIEIGHPVFELVSGSGFGPTLAYVKPERILAEYMAQSVGSGTPTARKGHDE